ncbi:hypothetical protein AB6A40_009079 [Gnathostoma spinigerum]|uniref:Uncharacterized protein n=1 Tax=Gnathostoma spinigerum TaxID=75299 RepID=A0ABD6EQX3_9BILA
MLPRSRRSKIAYNIRVPGVAAGNWEKFSTSNKRTSARPHWSRYRLCAKLTSNLRGALIAKLTTQCSVGLSEWTSHITAAPKKWCSRRVVRDKISKAIKVQRLEEQ